MQGLDVFWIFVFPSASLGKNTSAKRQPLIQPPASIQT